jgi:hypothetical protein
MPPIGEMKQDIQEIQQRVKITFHNDLFTGITDLQTVGPPLRLMLVARKNSSCLAQSLNGLPDKRDSVQPLIECGELCGVGGCSLHPRVSLVA